MKRYAQKKREETEVSDLSNCGCCADAGGENGTPRER